MTHTRKFPDLGHRLKTTDWDPAEHLETEEDIAAYLDAAFEEGDSSLIAAALGDVARAKGYGANRTRRRSRARKPLQSAIARRQS
jgi:probable addiction module antidote protein